MLRSLAGVLSRALHEWSGPSIVERRAPSLAVRLSSRTRLKIQLGESSVVISVARPRRVSHRSTREFHVPRKLISIADAQPVRSLVHGLATENARVVEGLGRRYRVERLIREGALACVCVAHDEQLDRMVVIKFLRPDVVATAHNERFLAEIRTTARMHHPHIVSLIDSGEANGAPYYVMPYIEGESVGDRLLQEKQLPIDDALRITTHVASALDYAHRLGVVHRDIKPANILLHEGEALVADLGIALSSFSAVDSRLTSEDCSLGTPRYMSPEQALGERAIDGRSDIYSLGCVLYEMLTGEPPFVGPSFQTIVGRLISDKPQGLRLVRAAVPVGVERAVLKALEKLPADRFATAGEFSSALLTPAKAA